MPLPSDPEIVARADALIAAELAAHPRATRADRMLIEEFAQRRARTRAITVTFPGGAERTAYIITRSNGAYTLVFLPESDLFSLCVDTIFGPVDIGVHGAALACFSSV